MRDEEAAGDDLQRQMAGRLALRIEPSAQRR